MAKKLNISAVVCDVRHIQEETLARYESISVQAVLLLTTARASALLAAHGAGLEVVNTVTLPEGSDVQPRVINGSHTLRAGNGSQSPQYLIVNGELTIAPDAAPALKNLIGATVNGELLGPESLVGAIPNLQVNGETTAYPDGATPMRDATAVLDASFPLRAASNWYWAAKRFVLVDPALTAQAAAMAAKPLRFTAPHAILTASLAPALAPLFDTDCELTVVPDGTAFVDDDLTLTAARLRRYGPRLYVNGDLDLMKADAALLEKLESLTVEGNVLLPEELLDAFTALDARCDGEMVTVRGRLLEGRESVTVDAALLAAMPGGATLVNCAEVIIDPALTPETLAEALRLYSCASVHCAPEQLSAVQRIAEDTGDLAPDAAAVLAKAQSDGKDGGGQLRGILDALTGHSDPNTVKIQAMQYTM